MDAASIEHLIAFLEACRDDEWLRLPGVGWLTVKEYAPYDGRNPRTGPPGQLPRKRITYFRPDPELSRSVNGLQPSNQSFPDEFARYLHAHQSELGDSEPPSADSISVARFSWADDLSSEIHATLITGRSAEAPGLGTFEIVEKPGRPGVNPQTGERITIPPRRLVRFIAGEQLKQRLRAQS